MTPDERALRRALDARSAEASPGFRARLSAVLAEGRPARDLRQPLAIAASVVLLVGSIAILLLSRQAPAPAPSRGLPTPPGVSAPSSTPTPTVSPALIPLPTTAWLSVPSANTLWVLVANSVLFRSTDGGQSWQQRPLPPAASSPWISFVDDRRGWSLELGSSAAQCQTQSVTIWRTADAGGTWQRLSASGIANAACKSSLSFVDANHGFLAAVDQLHAPVIYRTADGGATWTASRPLPIPTGFQAGGYSLEPGGVHALGSTLLLAYGDAVYRSTDGGATWTYVAGTPDHAASIAFVTASRWLEMPGTKETLDGGRTWHAYPSDYAQAAPIAPQVEFGDPATGYATVRGSIWRTRDGGLHWSMLQTPGTG